VFFSKGAYVLMTLGIDAAPTPGKKRIDSGVVYVNNAYHGINEIKEIALDIAGLIGRTRKALDLTQGALAQRLGVTVQTVNRWEAGEMSPREETKQAFVRVESQIGLLERVQSELDVVVRLTEAIQEEIKRLTQSRIDDSLTDRRAFTLVRDPRTPVVDLEQLRRQAYGRLVVARDVETGTQRIFRVAWGAASWPSLQVYNRNAPTVRAVMSASKGDTVLLPAGGRGREYEVLEVSLLFRHTDNWSVGREDDFRQLDFSLLPSGACEKQVEELRRWLNEARRALVETLTSGESVELPAVPEAEPALDESSRAALSERFFLQPLPLQEEAMRWRPEGHMLVEGVAGSGKTSVALGRAAMLCMERNNEGELGRYRPEAGVGFVLNDQLVRYLEDLLRRGLSLERMPVKSYISLRQELIAARALLRGGIKRSHEAQRDKVVLGAVEYAEAVEGLMVRAIADALLADLPASPTDFLANLPIVGPAHVEALEPHWARLRQEVRNALVDVGDTRLVGLRGAVERVDRIRGDFADALEHLGPWEPPRLSDARRRVRDRVRDAVGRAFDFGARYCEVVQKKEFADVVEKALADDPRTLGEIVGRVRSRASERKLSDEDIDCLLLIAHHAAEGYRGRDGAQPIGHLGERPYFTHVFIDEVQDFTAVQVRLMAAQADPRYRTVTAVGDFAQRLTEGGLVGAGSSGLELRPADILFLDQNKRQRHPLHALARDFRREIQNDPRLCRGEEPMPGDEAAYTLGEGNSTVEALRRELLETREKFPSYSMAVLCRDGARAAELESQVHDEMWSSNILTRVSDREHAGALCDAFHVHFTTPFEAKGLEFDAVFVVDVDAYDLDSPTDRGALYVALSRARRRLGLSYRARPAGRLAQLLDQHVKLRT
jgi:transcriptional regulator with XRE-family HTH domain